MAAGHSDLLRRRAAAVARLTKAAESLRGSLIERFLPCGNPNCKCRRGALHGPAYYVSVTYPKGRTRQVYVSKDAKPVVERWLGNYQEIYGTLEEISAINLELIRLKAIVPKR
jgi:Family of unknown function (DUF6788)